MPLPLTCIKESVDDNILPLISYAKTAKEAQDTLEWSFSVKGSIEVEYEGSSIAADLQQDEKFVESHYAQPQVDDVYEEVAKVAWNFVNDWYVVPTIFFLSICVLQ